MSRLGSWAAAEREKLRGMSVGQAIGYILTYYWIWILGIAFGVWLIVFLAVHLIAGEPQYRLYAVFANTTADAGNGSAIWKDFQAFDDFESDDEKVEFDANFFFDYTRNQGRGNSYYNAFVTLADTGTLDLITMDAAQLSALGQSGRLMDLNDPRCAEILKKYGDRLVWYEPPEDADETEPVPVGIDLSDSLLVTRYKLYPGDCALGVSAQSGRIDAVLAFLECVLEEGTTGA